MAGPEDRAYYRISHEDKDLFFNLSVTQGFLSESYILERRHGNLSHVEMVASSAPPCHLTGTVLQQGTRMGTAALSACQGLVSARVRPLLPCPRLLSPRPAPRGPVGSPTHSVHTSRTLVMRTVPAATWPGEPCIRVQRSNLGGVKSKGAGGPHPEQGTLNQEPHGGKGGLDAVGASTPEAAQRVSCPAGWPAALGLGKPGCGLKGEAH